METTSKRKHDSGDEANDMIAVAAPVTEKTTTAPHKKRLTIKIITPNEELFKKIPGEIRNRIYDLALLPEDPYKPSLDVHYRRPHSYFKKGDNYKRFREPALLRTAKWIRDEAKAIFYQSHDFVITVKSDEIEDACDWFRSIVCPYEDGYVSAPTFRVSKANWDHIHKWLPLAKLFSDLDFGRASSTYDAGSSEGFSWSRQMNDPFINAGPHVGRALAEVVKLGLVAREEGWSHDVLEVNFEECVESKLACGAAAPKKAMRSRLSRGIGAKQQEMMRIEKPEKRGYEKYSTKDGTVRRTSYVKADLVRADEDKTFGGRGGKSVEKRTMKLRLTEDRRARVEAKEAEKPRVRMSAKSRRAQAPVVVEEKKKEKEADGIDEWF